MGIDLGGTTVKFGILTSEGEVQEKWAIETNTLENGRHIVPNIVESLKHRLEMYGLTAEDFIELVWVLQELLIVKIKRLLVPST